MRTLIRLAVTGLCLSVATGLIVVAGAQSREREKRDPNEMVCEKQTVLGSRLATRRICMTRSQWAERRMLDRQTVDRSQTQLCVAVGGHCSRGN